MFKLISLHFHNVFPSFSIRSLAASDVEKFRCFSHCSLCRSRSHSVKCVKAVIFIVIAGKLCVEWQATWSAFVLFFTQKK